MEQKSAFVVTFGMIFAQALFEKENANEYQ